MPSCSILGIVLIKSTWPFRDWPGSTPSVLLPGGPARRYHQYWFIVDGERQDRLPGGFLKLLPQSISRIFVGAFKTNLLRQQLIDFATWLQGVSARRYHQYKFIVDGEWRHDEAQPFMPDPLGNVNNWLFVRRHDSPHPSGCVIQFLSKFSYPLEVKALASFIRQDRILLASTVLAGHPDFHLIRQDRSHASIHVLGEHLGPYFIRWIREEGVHFIAFGFIERRCPAPMPGCCFRCASAGLGADGRVAVPCLLMMMTCGLT